MLAAMTDLVGQVTLRRQLDDGLVLERVTCPLGLIGVVFEARPDALIQIAGLALRSGNAVILKGGREAQESNRALTAVVHEVLKKHGLDPRLAVLLEDRADVDAVLQQHGIVDLIGPFFVGTPRITACWPLPGSTANSSPSANGGSVVH